MSSAPMSKHVFVSLPCSRVPLATVCRKTRRRAEGRLDLPSWLVVMLATALGFATVAAVALVIF
jgi:hypothetical protein